MPVAQSRVALAHRLRDLRKSRQLTQAQLAEALQVSVAAISSWESETNTLVPTENRISEISLFYASSRSVSKRPFRLPGEEELTPQELARRDELMDELTGLRAPSGGIGPAGERMAAVGSGSWYFPDGGPVRVICGRLDESLRSKMPYTDVGDPDYTRLYNLADLDALLELYGHLRGTNPANPDVRVCTGDELTPDDLTCHLVVLGGVDFWDGQVRDLVDRLALPVTQVSRNPTGYFEVTGGAAAGGRAQKVRYAAELVRRDGSTELRSDVAHYYRGPNPYNRRRTVSMCVGMYSRGTYAAVRALTDDQFRGHNEDYLARRFPEGTMSVLMRVQVPAGASAVTPDWTDPATRLNEWPPRTTK